MAVSDIKQVLEFLKNNGFSESESALIEDIMDKSELGSLDYERFLFPMIPPPPLLNIPSLISAKNHSSSVSSDDEFVSLVSSATGFCSSEFTNPYGIRTTAVSSSQSSSDGLSQFGTARDYHDFDMQNDLFWYREKDEDFPIPPYFGSSEGVGAPSEDKFVMIEASDRQNVTSPNWEYKAERWPIATDHNGQLDEGLKDYYHLDKQKHLVGEGGMCEFTCSSPLCACCKGPKDIYGGDLDNMDINLTEANYFQYDPPRGRKTDVGNNYFIETSCNTNWIGDHKGTLDLQPKAVDEVYHSYVHGDYEPKDDRLEALEGSEPDEAADEEGGATSDELLMFEGENEFEVFNLRIIHRKNRTGFEESKELPIILNSIIAGRYYVTEYLGSAAFSKVIQAHDMHTGVDVCLKIIKNDKDFFDQSLDEIKLLKFVNKNDPCDEHHILRLYDYFYHQEHLFIVCELLRANLYEFQKYNRESDIEPYFTMSRLQTITRQCLEALVFLHNLGIIHCDLKPENILIKSYRRCEIKVIDLGSSCFQSDSLSLYVQSRSYRAPEVILGLPYDAKIDLWSLGCILGELCSGEVLFPNEAVVMLLARLIGMLGPIDTDMLERGQETYKYFTKDYDLYYINEDTSLLEYIIPEETSLEHQLSVSDPLFLDFVRKLLEITPQKRPTAKEALGHPWLSRWYK
ncbi:dual specificity tyrosine-phosphorylation-regulated kinase mbk-2 isoform X1 [Capsicum galapagoense]